MALAEGYQLTMQVSTAALVWCILLAVALSASVREMTDDDFKWVMDIDFWGVAHGTRAFLPHLIASGDGHVVNISSVFGRLACPNRVLTTPPNSPFAGLLKPCDRK